MGEFALLSTHEIMYVGKGRDKGGMLMLRMDQEEINGPCDIHPLLTVTCVGHRLRAPCPLPSRGHLRFLIGARYCGISEFSTETEGEDHRVLSSLSPLFGPSLPLLLFATGSILESVWREIG